MTATRRPRTVWVDGEIADMLRPQRELLRGLAEEGRWPITVVLSSPGGLVDGGFALMDEIAAVRAAGVPVHGLVQGLAASMAVTILQACEYRAAGPHALLMVHGPHGWVYGDQRDRKAHEHGYALQVARLARAYAARTAPLGGMDLRDWERIFEEDTPIWLSAEEALRRHLVDAIV